MFAFLKVLLNEVVNVNNVTAAYITVRKSTTKT